MTELYINDQRVYFDDSKQIKITVENPYFSFAGSYSLEVTIPMSIYQNRNVFGNIDRIEVTKENREMPARLVLENRTLINGVAKITKINRDTVIIQLSGRMTGDKFFAEHGDKYINEMDLGTPTQMEWNTSEAHIPGVLGEYVCMPVYDETNNRIYNDIHSRLGEDGLKYLSSGFSCKMPNFLLILDRIINSCGYKIIRNDVKDRLFGWGHLYIACAHKIDNFGEALPHWKISDFIAEVRNFFDCSILFDADKHEVSIIRNTTFFNGGIQTYPVIDEYVVEMKNADESEKSLSYSDIRYDLSNSSSHQYDRLSEELWERVPLKEFASHDETVAYVNSLSEKDKKSYIYKDDAGYFVWGEEYNNNTLIWKLTRVNHFCNLIRQPDNENTIDLKICPVGITREQEMRHMEQIFVTGTRPAYKERFRCHVPMLSLENSFGPPEQFGGNRNTPCVWDIITGEEDMPDSTEPEDRLQVFFVDTYLQSLQLDLGGTLSPKIFYPMPFTDWEKDLLTTLVTNRHNHWSLSLQEIAGTASIGDLHANSYSIKTDMEFQFDFQSNEIPDINKVFIFNNKRYVCRKFEYVLLNNKLSNIIRGYFYEMIGS